MENVVVTVGVYVRLATLQNLLVLKYFCNLTFFRWGLRSMLKITVEVNA